MNGRLSCVFLCSSMPNHNNFKGLILWIWLVRRFGSWTSISVPRYPFLGQDQVVADNHWLGLCVTHGVWQQCCQWFERVWCPMWIPQIWMCPFSRTHIRCTNCFATTQFPCPAYKCTIFGAQKNEHLLLYDLDLRHIILSAITGWFKGAMWCFLGQENPKITTNISKNSNRIWKL